MLPTPSTSHVPYDKVYEPAEDSFLLLDTLSSANETSFLKDRFDTTHSAPVVYEVGSGSGVVIAFVIAHARTIFDRDVLVLSSDINIVACKSTMKTIALATRSSSAQLGAINADLMDCIRPGSIDVLIFNPPYVPAPMPDAASTAALCAFRTDPEQQSIDGQVTDTYDHDSFLLSLSYAGGIDGMQVTNKLLSQLPSVLSEVGVAYILLCAQNKPQEVIKDVTAWGNSWTADIVGSSGKQAGWERLVILRIYRRHEA